MDAAQVLDLYPLPGVVSYFEPGPEIPARLTEDSPALHAMTDLCRQIAFTVEPNVPIDQALQRMKTVGVRLLFVVNGDKDILGLITSNDILGEKPLKFHNEQHQRYEEILVRDIMTPHARLEVLGMEDVQRATVSDIVATLRSNGRRHALVLDHDTHTDKPAIRGIFSATQIEKQLGRLIDTTEVATTFAEVEMALNS